MEYLNITPTWAEILPNWLLMYREAVRGHCADNERIIDNAEAEFRRMAEAADRWNEYCKMVDAVAGVDEMERVNEGLHPDA